MSCILFVCYISIHVLFVNMHYIAKLKREPLFEMSKLYVISIWIWYLPWSWFKQSTIDEIERHILLYTLFYAWILFSWNFLSPTTKTINEGEYNELVTFVNLWRLFGIATLLTKKLNLATNFNSHLDDKTTRIRI